MIQVNRIGDHISGSVNGQPFSVSYDATKYEKMVELADKAEKVDTMEELTSLIEEFMPLTQESYGDMIETISPYLMVNKSTNQFHLQFNQEVSTKPLPKALADRMIKAVEKTIDIAPLIKFWARWLRNPFLTDAKSKLLAEYIEAPYTNDKKVAELMGQQGLSKEVAVKAATTPQVAISREGLMVGYKVALEINKKYHLNEQEEVEERSRFGKDIDEDTGLVTYKKAQHNEERVFEPPIMHGGGDPFYCTPIGAVDGKPGHIIKVGHTIKLEKWDQVSTDDRASAVKGLHVGGLRYIAGYQQDQDTETHNVFIDPMHIGAIVGLGSGNDGALRVKQYFVYGAFTGVNKQLYHSSRYAELNDIEYAQMVEEAVKATSKKTEALGKEAKERAALSKI